MTRLHNGNGAAQAAATLKAPIYEYGHGGTAFEGQSVTGGIVYRGSKFKDLHGCYIYGDYSTGQIWAAKEQSGKLVRAGLRPEMADK